MFLQKSRASKLMSNSDSFYSLLPSSMQKRTSVDSVLSSTRNRSVLALPSLQRTIEEHAKLAVKEFLHQKMYPKNHPEALTEKTEKTNTMRVAKSRPSESVQAIYAERLSKVLPETSETAISTYFINPKEPPKSNSCRPASAHGSRSRPFQPAVTWTDKHRNSN